MCAFQTHHFLSSANYQHLAGSIYQWIGITFIYLFIPKLFWKRKWADKDSCIYKTHKTPFGCQQLSISLYGLFTFELSPFKIKSMLLFFFLYLSLSLFLFLSLKVLIVRHFIFNVRIGTKQCEEMFSSNEINFP